MLATKLCVLCGAITSDFLPLLLAPEPQVTLWGCPQHVAILLENTYLNEFHVLETEFLIYFLLSLQAPMGKRPALHAVHSTKLWSTGLQGRQRTWEFTQAALQLQKGTQPVHLVLTRSCAGLPVVC